MHAQYTKFIVGMSPNKMLGENQIAESNMVVEQDENDSPPHASNNNNNSNSSNNSNNNSLQVQRVLDNLREVETSLQSVLQTHRHGEYGFVTREWGFTAPGGLGGQLKGKFYPWEFKLRRCRTFFWPIECYEAMEEGPDFGRPDPDMIKDLPAESEQLYHNVHLHNFLKEPPVPAVELYEQDYREYRCAARIFLLLGTLSHLYGNSAPRGPKTAVLPEWIEDPLREVAKRLKIEPTLSGHFLVQENWIWKSDAPEESANDNVLGVRRRFQKRSSITLSQRRLSKNTSKKVERKIVGSILKECECADRYNGLKLHSDCFLGSQCIDIVMYHRFTETREEAVRMVRKINRVYKLFTHVTNSNYELMDKRYFYRFRHDWKTRRFMAVSGDLPDSSIEVGGFANGDEDAHNRSVTFGPPSVSFGPPPGEKIQSNGGMVSDSENESSELFSISSRKLARLSNSYNKAHIIPKTQTTKYDSMAIIHTMGKVKVKDRRYRLRIYKNCFVGKQLINVLMENECGTTRRECWETALAINQKYRLFDHVKGHHLLKDKHLFYRFTDSFRNMTESQAHASTLVEAGGRFSTFSGGGARLSSLGDEPGGTRFSMGEPKRIRPSRRVSWSEQESIRETPELPAPDKITRQTSRQTSADEFVDENLRPSFSYSDYGDSYDAVLGIEEEMEFGLDNITMLYPAFGNNHERINQLVPACMGFSLSSLPFDVLDILSAMRDVLEAQLNIDDYGDDNYEMNRLYDLVYKVAFSVSKCKEEFQQMSTDPKKRTFNSKYVSIKQTQPLSNGVLVRRTKGAEPTPAKGTTGTQFPYFHILDWLLGRFQYNNIGSNNDDHGLVSAIGSVDDTFPPPQREYIRCLSKLEETSTLRGFLEVIGRRKELLPAYNHLVECYAGEGGMLQAHCRKLYSYIHNNVQSSTSGTNHLADSKDDSKEEDSTSRSGCPLSSGSDESVISTSDESTVSGCPMHSSKSKKSAHSGCPMSPSANASTNSIDNHKFAITMFKHMRMAAADRWKLRLPPLMNEVGKVIYSTSESGGFTTVALDLSGSGLLYEYGDIVKVLLPNDDKQTLSWLHSLKSMNKEFFKMEDMINLQKNRGNGWGWDGLWEALGWNQFEENGGRGVPLERVARYIEQGKIRDPSCGTPKWVHSPLNLSTGRAQMFASPPPIPRESIISLEPVSPRIYSVSGVEIDRVFLLVSKPDDLARHHGYSSMSDPSITRVHCSFSPATFFLVPPKDTNLVCIASGTGISPFVGLVDSINSRTGSYTIVHQCKSSDMFMCNSQTWLDFTAMNPGAIVMGYISGDRSRRNCPMRYVIRNGAFEETTVLRRQRISAYYFECEMFQTRIFETYSSDSLNLAYCCGGVKSAIMPMQNFANSNGMDFEFTSESYGVPLTLGKTSDLLSQIGGTVIDLNHVSPIHPGGDQILRQAQDIVTSMEKSDTPDHSVAFYELHPHAYNLHRCLRTPVDADSKAFTKFLERQAMSKSVLGNMATKYAQAALSAPESSKIMKIATELQSSAISAQISSGDTEGAQLTASYLKQLLNHACDDDDDTERWERSLHLLPPSKRKSNVRFSGELDGKPNVRFSGELDGKPNVQFSDDLDGKDDDDAGRWETTHDLMPPSRRKSNVVFNRVQNDDDNDDEDGERWGQSHDLMPRSRRKSSVVIKTLES